jgi:LmbE family N-acetylglucosaminyl deacetylase
MNNGAAVRIADSPKHRISDVRRAACTVLDHRLRRRLKPFDEADWGASAIIFAPHPDDETLGCGGVACKKIAAGAQMRFVFVTDGAASHRHRMAAEALRAMREAEAIEAVARLGAPSDHVTFLRFPDGDAMGQVEAIAAAAGTLLRSWHPQSVFVVHAKDPTADHVAVNAGVRAAVRAYARPVTVFEYPIWYWYHWPWVRMHGDLPRMWRVTARQTIKTAAGLGALSTFNTQAYVGDVLGVKREALAAHASQTRRLDGQDDWAILADLSGGDFLKRLLVDYETFTRYEANA